MIPRKPQRVIARIRAKLRAANPHCHWCGCLTLPETPPPFHPDMATLDHLKARWECADEAEYHAEANTVLSCFECNQTRDKIERETKGENRRLREEMLRRKSERDAVAALVRPTAPWRSLA